MADIQVLSVNYADEVIFLHLHLIDKNLFLEEKDISKIWNIDLKTLSVQRERLIENRHFKIIKIKNINLDQNNNLYIWNFNGLIRLAIYLQKDDVLEFIENIEKKIEPHQQNNKIGQFWNDIENILQKKLEEISDKGSLAELEKLIAILSKFEREKNSNNERRDGSFKQMAKDIFEDAFKTVSNSSSNSNFK